MTGTGKIARLVKDKGFGFIKVEGREKDLFFHSNSLIGVTFDELKDGDDGDILSFDIENSAKGENAVNVKRA